MRPYTGKSVEGVDTSTLVGKVMCGYQGWFACEGDGSQTGWNHYVKQGKFEPGSCNIDFWPDVSGLDTDEKYATPFRHADRRTAYMFSSYNRKTVLRHFQWMRDYGIDGAFVQRFGVSTNNDKQFNRVNVVLSHCREGANLAGCAYAVMYDLSGMKAGQIDRVIEDWRLLVSRMGITRDKADHAYLHHKGKPVVTIWGPGFKDREIGPAECGRLVDFLKNDRDCGGCAVMLGVPTGWRTLTRDSVNDKTLLDLIAKADIVSPWTVGRYRDPEGAAQHAKTFWAPDMAFCREHGQDYLPVVFPGFSWHNKFSDAPLNAIPRMKGQFLWSQYVEAKRAGATMIYQAMFDEMDEGTCVFKCENDAPVGASPFVTYEGLPSDHYLWLVGQGGRMLRGEIEATEAMPKK